jgi:ubiquinone/menaquinone biosynthesis C-methylase UbiE
MSRWRSNLVQNLEGMVLEIGVGTGENLLHYRRASCVWAVEPDAGRAEEARRIARQMTMPVQIDVAPAEQLPYDDAMFDNVVASLVFCSVTDQRAALNEIRRVLKPGGALHLVEHVRPGNFLLAWLFSVATPLWSRVACNCHLDRPTLDVLRAEGWRVDVHKRRLVFVRATARPAAN